MENPVIQIEGRPYRSNTFPIRSSEADSLAEILRVRAVDLEETEIYPLKLLRRLFTRDRVLAELKRCEIENAEKYADLISSDQEEIEPPYIRIFAILVLIEKGEMIDQFVREQLGDQTLPFRRDNKIQYAKRDALLFFKNSNDPIPLLRSWKPVEREQFETTQWKVLVPCLKLNGDHTVREYELRERDILPWSSSVIGGTQSSIPSTATGAYGKVYCVKIDPDCHSFQDFLRTVKLDGDMFAVKELLKRDFNDESQFRKELDHLKRFNGRVHDHLVTLLTTITKKMAGPDKQYHFVFPYARCALDEYWQVNKHPQWDIKTVRWVSRQLLGIMGAMNSIHMPTHLHANTRERKYGMHSDIKPDNILWFNSHDDVNGILVISDFGSAAIHSDKSRSNIPNDRIPAVPGYRPPECDIQGGYISRRYDIWTLGCLFLEILTWLMGGQKSLDDFKEDRMKTVYITGAKRDMFYAVKKLELQNPGAIQLRNGGATTQISTEKEWYALEVKKEVKDWINRLHTDERCSDFIHDVLNSIEKEMLIILSEGESGQAHSSKTRASSDRGPGSSERGS